MNTTLYRASRDKRLEFWRAVALSPAVALAVGLLMAIRQFTLGHVAFLTGIAFAMIALIMLWFSGRYLGSTTTDNTGIRVRGAIVRRSIPWRGVRSVEILDINTRGTHTYMLQVHRTQGRSVKLPGLIASAPDDPRLLGDLEAIRTSWETAAGEPTHA